MKEKIVYFVKHNKVVYGIYYACMSLALDIAKLFIKKDGRLILFVSYGGRFFNESPKALYDAMKADSRFQGYKLVWAFREPDKFPEVKERIKIDSWEYYETAIKARCWITNVAIERGLSFKSKHNYYFHTTHTTLPKLMGYDDKDNRTFNAFQLPEYDCSCACSEYEAERQTSMFRIDRSKVLLSGYPKNDNLTKYSTSEIEAIKKKLCIPRGKKIILYAPTYREDAGTTVGLNVDIERWRRILGEEYVVLFRVHPTMISGLNLKDDDSFIHDVSTYPDNTDLMKIADVLVSDYSGIFFEYAVLKRPMYCYGYDYEEYVKKRKLYFDIRKELPGGMLDEENLLKLIKTNLPEAHEQVRKFREKYVTVYGNATEVCLNHIYEELNRTNK